MLPHSPYDLQELKRKHLMAKDKNFAYREALAKREEVEKKIEKQRVEIEKAFMPRHRQGRQGDSDKGCWEQLTAELAALQQALRTIDREVDTLEEECDDADAVEKELIEAIVAAHTELVAPYAAVVETIASCSKEVVALKTLYEAAKAPYRALEEMRDMYRQTRRRGIISYIFGRNPNVVISHLLREAGALSRLGARAVEQYGEGGFASGPKKRLCDDLSPIFELLVVHAERRWGFSDIERTFLPAGEQLALIIKEIERCLESCQQELQAAHALPLSWIDAYVV